MYSKICFKICCLETFDETQLYLVSSNIKVHDNVSFLYHRELIIEAIVDSRMDGIEYASSNLYTKYLSKNVCIENMVYVNTIDILCFLYL